MRIPSLQVKVNDRPARSAFCGAWIYNLRNSNVI